MDRHKAIRNIYKNAKRVDDGEGAFDENGNQITLDESKISIEMERLKTEYDSKQYQRDRASQYLSIQEQLDMQYWDAVNGTKKWQEAVAKVKTDNPKPE
tara:strand:- start:153 stop:449 length:297 start_codon:yes stop_codon:yes gene_type:complete